MAIWLVHKFQQRSTTHPTHTHTQAHEPIHTNQKMKSFSLRLILFDKKKYLNPHFFLSESKVFVGIDLSDGKFRKNVEAFNNSSHWPPIQSEYQQITTKHRPINYLRAISLPFPITIHP